MALFSVVRFDGLKSRNWMIYKYPSEDLVIGSQLIVQEGQLAIFVKGGTVADVFYPGTHTLSTENLPVLNKLVNLPFGGKTPFSAEVYFINTTVGLDINWGTIDPIQLTDPKYYVQLHVRAFGQMGLRILDGVNLFKSVIGGMQKNDVVKFDKVKDYFKGILVLKVKSAIADMIITNQISALEIAAKLEELSEKVKEQISPEFAKYGFSIVNFYIQSINFPDEDFDKINKILENKAEFEIMGNQRYGAMRSFDIYEAAVNNQNGVAGAVAAGGIGFGTAVNMVDSINRTLVKPEEAQQPAPSTKTCFACHATIPLNSKFCPECGANNAPQTCTCGNILNPGTKFCPECGKKVE